MKLFGPAKDVALSWHRARCVDIERPSAHRTFPKKSYHHLPISKQIAWLSEWWYCPGCAHGGHASCLQLWHGTSDSVSFTDPSAKYSDGCCPSDGCGHACLPGKYSDELATARSEELGRAAVDSSRARDSWQPGSRGGSRRSSPGASVDRSVKSDTYDVPQSKAVGMAREALNKSGGGGILSSSPGRTSNLGDKERRKSVKFAKTDRG